VPLPRLYTRQNKYTNTYGTNTPNIQPFPNFKAFPNLGAFAHF